MYHTFGLDGAEENEISQPSNRTTKPNEKDFPVLSVAVDLKDQHAQTHRRK